MSSSVPQVFDVSDLAAIAELEDLPHHPDDDLSILDLLALDKERYRSANERQMYQAWLRAARPLAAKGVHIAPSHKLWGNGHVQPNVWGPFQDAEELTETSSPVLVMFATLVEKNASDLPYLPEGFEYHAVAHQTAGIACHHRYLVGIPLVLSDEGFKTALAVSTFADRNGHDCVGIFGLSLSQLSEYHHFLQRLSLSCERNFEELEEGFYPVDLSCISQFTEMELPNADDFAKEFASESPLKRLQGLSNNQRWGIYVLSENCD